MQHGAWVIVEKHQINFRAAYGNPVSFTVAHTLAPFNCPGLLIGLALQCPLCARRAP